MLVELPLDNVKALAGGRSLDVSASKKSYDCFVGLCPSLLLSKYGDLCLQR